MLTMERVAARSILFAFCVGDALLFLRLLAE